MPPRRKSSPRSPEMGSLGEAIRQLRVEAKLSQERLAELVETDFTQIGGIERGTGNPNYTTLLRLAAALETRVGSIASLADEIYDRRDK